MLKLHQFLISFPDLGNRSKVTKTDKWIIMKFGENSKEKYKHWSDIPDYVK